MVSVTLTIDGVSYGSKLLREIPSKGDEILCREFCGLEIVTVSKIIWDLDFPANEAHVVATTDGE